MAAVRSLRRQDLLRPTTSGTLFEQLRPPRERFMNGSWDPRGPISLVSCSTVFAQIEYLPLPPMETPGTLPARQDPMLEEIEGKHLFLEWATSTLRYAGFGDPSEIQLSGVAIEVPSCGIPRSQLTGMYWDYEGNKCPRVTVLLQRSVETEESGIRKVKIISAITAKTTALQLYKPQFRKRMVAILHRHRQPIPRRSKEEQGTLL